MKSLLQILVPENQQLKCWEFHQDSLADLCSPAVLCLMFSGTYHRSQSPWIGCWVRRGSWGCLAVVMVDASKSWQLNLSNRMCVTHLSSILLIQGWEVHTWQLRTTYSVLFFISSTRELIFTGCFLLISSKLWSPCLKFDCNWWMFVVLT